ncbi:MAG: hypothetical protein ACO29M_05895, partial [Fluviibacter sp.]
LLQESNGSNLRHQGSPSILLRSTQGQQQKGEANLDYRSEIIKMTSRVPQKVRDGSIQQAIAWKKLQEKAVAVTRKFRATELELSETYSQLKQYE